MTQLQDWFRNGKKFSLALCSACLVFSSCGKSNDALPARQDEPLYSASDTASYALGFMLAKEAERNQIKLDIHTLMKGLEDGMKGNSGIHPDSILRYYGEHLEKTFRDGYFNRIFFLAAENLKRTEKKLAEIRSREGVATLPSGILYKVVRTGTGAFAPANGKVSVRYRAANSKDVVFHDSWEAGAPEILELKGLIPGIQNALSAMHEGSEWELWIPPALAYQEEGLPGKVDPNDLVHLRLEFIAIQKEIPQADSLANRLAPNNRRDTLRALPPQARQDTQSRNRPSPPVNPAPADTGRSR